MLCYYILYFTLYYYTLQYSVNITFICTGKPKNSCDLLYCNICFISVVWNQTCNNVEVCLYICDQGEWWPHLVNIILQPVILHEIGAVPTVFWDHLLSTC